MKFILIKYIYLILSLSIVLGQGQPSRFNLTTAIEDTFLISGLKSNVVAEVKVMKDSITWFGTGRGLALHNGHRVYAYQTTNETLDDGQFTYYLPEGGIPAIGVIGDTVAVSFSGDDGTIQIGLGIVLTYDASDTNGVTWTYLSQPTDNDGDTLIPFGEGYYRQLPVTVPQANITYDISLSGDYLWIASWAGGLRRYDLTQKSWENVPMPMDNQLALSLCQDSAFVDTTGKAILADYYLNPRDPSDGGNHNHKALSVLAFGDTVWVGTADGINKGLLIKEVVEDPDGNLEIYNCIEWVHYSYPNHSLSGNFVVGLAKQIWNGQRTIWAATLNADQPGEIRGLSYTRDDGLSWQTTLLEERVYNVIARDSLVFAATASGLWKSLNGINWAKFNPAVDTTFLSQKEILTDIVYTAALDNRDTIPKIWIGTPDGIALSSDLSGSNWSVFQTDYDSSDVYAYPNPFSPFSHNQVGDDGYIRFHTGPIVNTEVKVDIFNFAMEKVHTRTYNLNNYHGAIKWDGRGQDGNHVSNGVYFARLNFAYSKSRAPADYWTKIIMVK